MARDDEAMRYRQAAHLALEQLEWCVEYLRSIHKTRLSKQVAQNRAAIARRLEDPPSGSVSREHTG
jgi:hypothetical protein